MRKTVGITIRYCETYQRCTAASAPVIPRNMYRTALITPHPSLVLDLDPEELDGLRSEESLARVRQGARGRVHCHLFAAYELKSASIPRAQKQ